MIIFSKTNFDINESIEGQSIEEKMRQNVMSGQPIENAAPMIYTDKKDGVLPQYDIRTDRWDIALNATDKVARAQIAKTQENPGIKQVEAEA